MRKLFKVKDGKDAQRAVEVLNYKNNPSVYFVKFSISDDFLYAEMQPKQRMTNEMAGNIERSYNAIIDTLEYLRMHDVLFRGLTE
jgi:hypothetical protein